MFDPPLNPKFGKASALLFLLALSGCKDRVESAFSACMADVTAKAHAAAGQKQAQTEADKKIAAEANQLYLRYGEHVCKSIKTSCAQDKNGPACQAALADFAD